MVLILRKYYSEGTAIIVYRDQYGHVNAVPEWVFKKKFKPLKNTNK